CDLSDKPEQAVQTFFENSQSSDMSSDEIVTKGIFSNLKLYVVEHRLLVDIKKTLYFPYKVLKVVFPPLT
ncbi:P52 family lipoprotein, partial [Borreliella garinii]|uniref:P52 family lipoprotein n=1 Tax=Borreliella garinii TaxID=29519 RepID=UPI003AF31B0F